MNPKLTKSVGHIPLAFSIEDAPKPDYSNERTATTTHQADTFGSVISGAFSLFDVTPNGANVEEE